MDTQNVTQYQDRQASSRQSGTVYYKKTIGADIVQRIFFGNAESAGGFKCHSVDCTAGATSFGGSSPPRASSLGA